MSTNLCLNPNDLPKLVLLNLPYILFKCNDSYIIFDVISRKVIYRTIDVNHAVEKFYELVNKFEIERGKRINKITIDDCVLTIYARFTHVTSDLEPVIVYIFEPWPAAYIKNDKLIFTYSTGKYLKIKTSLGKIRHVIIVNLHGCYEFAKRLNIPIEHAISVTLLHELTHLCIEDVGRENDHHSEKWNRKFIELLLT